MKCDKAGTVDVSAKFIFDITSYHTSVTSNTIGPTTSLMHLFRESVVVNHAFECSGKALSDVIGYDGSSAGIIHIGGHSVVAKLTITKPASGDRYSVGQSFPVVLQLTQDSLGPADSESWVLVDFEATRNVELDSPSQLLVAPDFLGGYGGYSSLVGNFVCSAVSADVSEKILIKGILSYLVDRGGARVRVAQRFGVQSGGFLCVE